MSNETEKDKYYNLTYVWSLKKKKAKFIETKSRKLVSLDGVCGVVEMGEGGQKV